MGFKFKTNKRLTPFVFIQYFSNLMVLLIFSGCFPTNSTWIGFKHLW